MSIALHSLHRYVNFVKKNKALLLKRGMETCFFSNASSQIEKWRFVEPNPLHSIGVIVRFLIGGRGGTSL